MPKLPPQDWKVLRKLILSLGYQHERTQGSHMVFVKPGVVKHVTLQKGKDKVPVGTMVNGIMKQLGLTRDEFIEALEASKRK